MRLLLIFVFVLAQIGKGLVALKNELISGFLYFIVMAPAVFIRRLLPARRSQFSAPNSSWIDIKTRERLQP